MKQTGFTLNLESGVDLTMLQTELSNLQDATVRIDIHTTEESRILIPQLIEQIFASIDTTKIELIFYIIADADFAFSEELHNLIKDHPCVRIGFVCSSNGCGLPLHWDTEMKKKSDVFLYYNIENVPRLFATFQTLYRSGFSVFDFQVSQENWNEEAIDKLCQQLIEVASRFVAELSIGSKLTIKNFQRFHQGQTLFPKELAETEQKFRRRVSLLLAKIWLSWQMVGKDKNNQEFLKKFIGVEDLEG